MGISTEQAEDLKAIAALNEEAIAEISDSFDKTESNLTDPAVIQEIIEPYCNIENKRLKSVSSAISGLLYSYIASEQKENDFIDDLVTQTTDSDITWNSKDIFALRYNLLKLFAITPLFVAHKARTLVLNSERLMTDSRILTDIRPVFEQWQVDSILGYAISHTLKINYSDSRGEGEFYVALDSSDLRSLKQVIERALEKQESIKNKSGISPKGFIKDS